MTEVSRQAPADFRESLLKFSTALLADARVSAGLPESHLASCIRPVAPYSRMVGMAETIRLEVSEDVEHGDLSLLIRSFETPATRHPIIVIEVPPPLHGYGIFGEGSAVFARARGFVGALVEGGVRDSHELRDADFPTFSRAVSPGYIRGKATAVARNQPVVVGGRTIYPGDVIMGDNDGVIIIRPTELEDVIRRAQSIKIWEARIHELLGNGHDYDATIKSAGSMPMPY